MPSWVSSTVTAFSGREAEVVDPVDVRGSLRGVAVVGVHLGEHLQPQTVRLRGEIVDEGERLRRQEARRTGGLHRVAHGVQAHHGDPALRQAAEHPRQVVAGRPVVDVEVDLVRCERGPQQPGPRAEDGACEGEARPGPDDAEQVCLGGAAREDPVVGEEHPGRR
jgi:hypothetical protein